MVKPTIAKEIQIKIFRKFKSEILQVNGNAQPCTHKIYEKLMKELQGMSEKSIQTSINRKISDIFDEEKVSFFEVVSNSNSRHAIVRFLLPLTCTDKCS